MAERLYPNATLFLEIIIFLIILAILGRYLFKPILRVIEERKRRIDGARAEAERLKLEIKNLFQDYNSRIAEARGQASRVIEDIKKEGEELGKDLIQKAKTENEKYFNESKEKIWKEAQELKKRLITAAQEISNDLTSKILQ